MELKSSKQPNIRRIGVYQRFFKRPMDIVLSIIAMIFLSPLLLVVAILVRMKLGCPVIFRQVRPGLHEKLFTLYKFRTMTDKKDESGELLPDSQRLTKFGNLLRSTSIDELPELWNVFRGEMSIVGPRPQLVDDMMFMTMEQRQRHIVLPGLSGLAQVNGRNGIEWDVKLSYDLEYIKHITIFNDLKLIIMTVVKVSEADSINFAGMATSENLGDYLLRTENISQEEFNKKRNESSDMQYNG